MSTNQVAYLCFFMFLGAVILLGRTNMFRFNHPKEAAKLREKRKVSSIKSLGANSAPGRAGALGTV